MPDTYNDTSIAETPAQTETASPGYTGGPTVSAKGRPPGVKESDGTENLRASGSAKQAGNVSAPMGTKNNWPKGVTSYTDSEV